MAEYDGKDHRSAARQHKDNLKHDAFREVGLELVRFSGADLRNRGLIVSRLTQACARAQQSTIPRACSVESLPDDLESRLQIKERLHGC